MPHDAVLDEALDDEGKGEPPWTPDFASDRKDRKVRHRDAMMAHELLREILFAGEHHPAWIAARVGHAHEFEIAHHVLVVRDLALKLHEQIEHDMRLPVLDRFADRAQLIRHAERVHFVPVGPQRADHVVLGLPTVDLRFAVALERIRGHQILVEDHQDAESLHSGTQRRRAEL